VSVFAMRVVFARARSVRLRFGVVGIVCGAAASAPAGEYDKPIRNDVEEVVAHVVVPARSRRNAQHPVRACACVVVCLERRRKCQGVVCVENNVIGRVVEC
jgi:hypothetical protein